MYINELRLKLDSVIGAFDGGPLNSASVFVDSNSISVKSRLGICHHVYPLKQKHVKMDSPGDQKSFRMVLKKEGSTTGLIFHDADRYQFLFDLISRKALEKINSSLYLSLQNVLSLVL